MPRNTTISKLKGLAKMYQCENNPLFVSALEQYIVQQRMIEAIRQELDAADDLSVEKSYTKGNANLYAHPLVKELPKHSDSANKTAELLLKIIRELGVKKKEADEFEDFLSERDDG